MKMKKNILKLSFGLAALAGVTLFSSCMDNNDDYTPQPRAALSILHAAPGIGGADIYLNDNKISNKVFKFTNHGATPVKPADYKISFVSPVSKEDTLATVSDSLKNGASYSAILYDTASEVKLMLFEDQYANAQSSGATFLRFLQLSPGNDAVTINIDQEEFTANRHFADNLVQPDVAEFKPLSYGKYNITALDASGDTLDHLENAELQGSGYYTLYLSGYEGATEDSLKLQLRLIQTY